MKIVMDGEGIGLSRRRITLSTSGVVPGERVAFLDRNSIEFFEVFFGCSLLGAVSVAVNWRLAPAELAAIVDWEMGTVGDPKLDLGWVVQSWPDDTTADEDRTGGYVDMTGMPSRDEVLAHYAKTSGRQVDDIDYYCVLAKWKLAVVLEQGFQRAGGDEKLQAFGAVVLDLMQSAADLAASTDYSVLA